jgi:hypothetical protein
MLRRAARRGLLLLISKARLRHRLEFEGTWDGSVARALCARHDDCRKLSIPRMLQERLR